MGVPKPQGLACDDVQESFQERTVRPMLVAHGLAMKLNLCIFKTCLSSKIPCSLLFFFFFFLVWRISFCLQNNGDGSWWLAVVFMSLVGKIRPYKSIFKF